MDQGRADLPRATSDGHSFVNDRLRGAAFPQDIGRNDFHPLARDLAKRTGRGIEGTDGAFDLFGALAEVEMRLRLVDLGGIGDALHRLRRRLDERELSEHIDHSPCTQNGKFISQLPSSLRSEEHTSELQSLMRISYA